MIRIERNEVFSTVEGMMVRRKGGSGAYRRMTVLVSDTEDDFEEVGSETVAQEMEAAEARLEYRQRVNSMIRARYDAEEEFALLRKGIAGTGDAAEFDAYNAYVEECKREARRIQNN